MRLTWQQELALGSVREGEWEVSPLVRRVTHSALVRKGLAVGEYPVTLTAAGIAELKRVRKLRGWS